MLTIYFYSKFAIGLELHVFMCAFVSMSWNEVYLYLYGSEFQGRKPEVFPGIRERKIHFYASTWIR